MMFSVVGGTYREICLEPDWDELYGSGLRAAAAVAGIVSNSAGQLVHLHTWINAEQEAALRLRTESYGIECSIYQRVEAVEFQWEHGLAVPRTFPDPDRITPIAELSLSLKKGILFGMMENFSTGAGQMPLKVDASVLVYDPQGQRKAIPFKQTGSKAEKLAICANLNEGVSMLDRLGIRDLGDENKPFAVGKRLRDAESAEVVVIKNGAEGAFVITPDDSHFVCSYKTPGVFKIGSGDVFSAVFAAYWAGLDLDPVEAARRASVATAYHSMTRVLPVPADADMLDLHLVPHKRSTAQSERPQVYIAAPIFNYQQRWFVNEIRRCLDDSGVKAFSPYHHVGALPDDHIPDDVTRVVRLDIEGLDRSSVVFAVLDGMDAGTLFEVGYATAKGKPVVGFRQCVSDGDLTMLLGSPTCQIVDDFPTAIYKAAWIALEGEA